MNDRSSTSVDRFAAAAQSFCTWALSPVSTTESDVWEVAELLADLVAAGWALGQSDGYPDDPEIELPELEKVRLKASSLPIQFYSETLEPLQVPPEETGLGDFIDDLVDVYGDVAPGLQLYNAARRDEALAHWQFWFRSHWGEHAVSALRALWYFMAGRKGSYVERHAV